MDGISESLGGLIYGITIRINKKLLRTNCILETQIPGISGRERSLYCRGR